MSFASDNIQDLYLSRDEKQWLTKKAATFISHVDIKRNDTILDFGSRVGNYTLPIAKYLASDQVGKIYALDKDKHSLDILKRRAEQLNVSSCIEFIKTDGSLNIPLEDNSLDVILLFDVFHEIGNKKCIEKGFELFKEFIRVLKPHTGRMLLYLTHLHKTGLSKKEILNYMKKDFIFQAEKEIEVLHWDRLMWGAISMFHVKKKK